MERSGLAKPLAKKFLRNVARGAGSRHFSVHSAYKEKEFKNTRNRHEVEFLARTIDLLRKKRYELVLETVVRRLVGVETADRSGDWKLCDAFELITSKQSYVPDEFMARALKTVRRIEAIEGKSSNTAAHKGGAGSAGHAGRQSRGYGVGSSSSSSSGSAARDRSTSRGPSRSSANHTDASKSAKGGAKDTRGSK